MPLHRYVVNVPNPTPKPVSVALRIEPVPASQLDALLIDTSPGTVEVRGARLSLEPDVCPDRPGFIRELWHAVAARLGRRSISDESALEIRLEPDAAVDVHVELDAAPGTGVAAVNLVDARGGEVVGGVTLLVIQGIEEPDGKVIEARNPCPIQLAQDIAWLPLDSEPDETPPGGPVPAGYEVELVAWVTNATDASLSEARAYLEHLGRSGADFVPVTWNLGTLEPGDRFPLMWRIRTNAGTRVEAYASIVVASKGTDPVRLPARFDVDEQRAHDEAAPRDVAPTG